MSSLNDRHLSSGPSAGIWALMIALHASALWLGGCGTRETAGRTADSSGASGATASAAGDVALPAMATRSAAWLPPGATDGDWRMPSRDYGATRYSPLAEITTANASQLQLAWTFDDGES
ncbi:MAG: hypothetical protein ABIY52_07140, partial [Gemmatimonadaceae bacterium]